MSRSIFLLMALSTPGFCESADTPAIATWGIEAGTPWRTSGEFIMGTEMSGIATLDGTKALGVSNETRKAQAATLDPGTKTLAIAPQFVPLLPNRGPEIDLEGLCADPSQNCYYAIGSHALGKSSGEVKPDQEWLFRIQADATTKAVSDTSQVTKTSLTPWMLSDPVLKNHARQPLKTGGANIEGLAFREGMLYVGFRSPNIADAALIAQFSVEKLFGPEAKPENVTAAKWHRLPMSPGQGIRGMAETATGLLLLTGHTGVESAPDDKVFSLWFWNPGEAAAQRIGALPLPERRSDANAESLLVLAETDDALEVLVIFDGKYNGMPTQFRLKKPTAASPPQTP